MLREQNLESYKVTYEAEKDVKSREKVHNNKIVSIACKQKMMKQKELVEMKRMDTPEFTPKTIKLSKRPYYSCELSVIRQSECFFKLKKQIGIDTFYIWYCLCFLLILCCFVIDKRSGTSACAVYVCEMIFGIAVHILESFYKTFVDLLCVSQIQKQNSLNLS